MFGDFTIYQCVVFYAVSPEINEEPYISVLKDDILIQALADFLEFHCNCKQEDLAETALDLFVFDGREALLEKIYDQLRDKTTIAWMKKILEGRQT